MWLLACCLGACGPGEKPPPNVLLVVLDTTRADAVDAAPTPVLDRLAAEGTAFQQARSTSAWTVPSHGSLLTGLYPSRHGAHHEHLELAAAHVTLAERLAATHQTAGLSENPHIGPGKGFDQGFETFVETWRLQTSAADIAPTDELALEWLAGRDPDRPFFLFVNFMAPHLPYAPPAAFQDRTVPPMTAPEVLERLRSMNEWAARLYMTGQLSLSADELSLLRGLYHAEVSFADARLGRLLQALAQAGELDRTLVVVVGDHGENIGDHGLMEHQFCLYDSLLRVPLVMRLPGTVEAGARRGDPAQLTDVLPTVLDALGRGEDAWGDTEGRSLLRPLPPERPQVAEYMRPVSQRPRFEAVAPGFDFTPFDRRLRAVVVRGRKLIQPEGGEPELYDLAADPGETRNLAADEPELARRLGSWLSAWAERAPAGPPVAGGAEGGEAPELDAETRRALEALGYL